MKKCSLLEYIFYLILILLCSSCKLASNIPTAEFRKCQNMSEINGTYAIPKINSDSMKISYPRIQNDFRVGHLLKKKDRNILRDKEIERLNVFFDGKNKITFTFFDRNEEYAFTYKCKQKDDYLEIYFKKTRIWALPLFMNYEYDRVRLGLNGDSTFVIHKWYSTFASLTIVPFCFLGYSDYRTELVRIAEYER